MKSGKTMSGVYYGIDSEIKEFPEATEERRSTCGYGRNCCTCMWGIRSSLDYPGEHPQRCRLK